MFIYFDDWLLTAPSPEILRDQNHSFQSGTVARIHHQLPEVGTSTRPEGAILRIPTRLLKGMVFPTEDRVHSVIQCASPLLQEVAPPARLWVGMLGLITSLKYMLPQSIPRMQIIQLHVGRFRSHRDSLSHRINRTTQVSSALSWWTQPSNVRRGKRFVPLLPSSILTGELGETCSYPARGLLLWRRTTSTF